MSREALRFRQIHLDFHTSEAIADIGKDFDPDEFTRTLSDAGVNQITLFGRGHHGWCYYPTTIGTAHPNLVRPDLLGEQVQACRNAGILPLVYNTVQWDELTAREHPEWRAMTADGAIHAPAPGDRSTSGQLSPTWHPICLSHEGAVDQVVNLTLEQIERYQPAGMFLDILLDWSCVCPACLKRMEQDGLNPEDEGDRALNDRNVIMDYYRAVTDRVASKYPDVRLFHNSGHIYRGDRERYVHFSHLELESLPTGGWGYDHFPMSVTYASTLGLDYVGMTGKFHTLWGEFGGYKTPDALEYECAMMIAHGAACSIGDQLHPRGYIEADTYQRIRPAYRRVERYEPFVRNASLKADVAVLSSEAFRSHPVTRTDRTIVPDAGVSRMLLQLHIPFHMVDRQVNLEDYRMVILPDDIPVDEDMVGRLQSYMDGGGIVFASGRSGLSTEDGSFALPLGAETSLDTRVWNPDYLQRCGGSVDGIPEAEFVVYQPVQVIRSVNSETTEVLAEAVAPYFNRRWNHFVSHQHTPPNPDARDFPERSPAIVRRGRLVYSASPLFTEYFYSGQPIIRSLFAEAVAQAGFVSRVRTNLPSSGKITLTRQESENRTVVHLLYAPSQLRGSGLRYPEGHVLPVEIIDDVPAIHDIRVELEVPSRPAGVSLASGVPGLRFEWSDGRLTVDLPAFRIHDAVVISD